MQFKISIVINIKADLVGFREENVLQVSAFYKSDVQINYLAELVTDNSAAVKEGLVSMLGELMTEMGDRYDHQTRFATRSTSRRSVPTSCYVMLCVLHELYPITSSYVV